MVTDLPVPTWAIQMRGESTPAQSIRGEQPTAVRPAALEMEENK